MAITFYWTCESETLGASDYSASDNTATKTGSPTIASAAGKIGTNGISSPASASSHYAFDASGIVGFVGSAGYWWQAVGAWPASGGVCGFQVLGTNSGDLLAVISSSTDELQFRNAQFGGTSVNLTTSANLVPDTWYGIIVRWDFTTATASKKKIEIYDSSGVAISGMPAEVTSADYSTSKPADLVTLQIARHSASSTSIHYNDNYIIADTYDGVTSAMLSYSSYSQFSPTTIVPKAMHYRRMLARA